MEYIIVQKENKNFKNSLLNFLLNVQNTKSNQGFVVSSGALLYLILILCRIYKVSSSLFSLNLHLKDGQKQFQDLFLKYQSMFKISMKISNFHFETQVTQGTQRTQGTQGTQGTQEVQESQGIQGAQGFQLGQREQRIIKRLQKNYPLDQAGILFNSKNSKKDELTITQILQFQGIWKYPFQKIQPAFEFKTLKMWGSTVEMMYLVNGFFLYHEDENGEYLILEYANSSLGFCLFLPKNIGLSILLENNLQEKFDRLITGQRSWVNVGIPKFDARFTWNLQPFLSLFPEFQSSELKGSFHQENILTKPTEEKSKIFLADHSFRYDLIDLENRLTLFSGVFDGYN